MPMHIKFELGKHKKFLQWCFPKIGLVRQAAIILKNIKGVTFINLIKIL